MRAVVFLLLTISFSLEAACPSESTCPGLSLLKEKLAMTFLAESVNNTDLASGKKVCGAIANICVA